MLLLAGATLAAPVMGWAVQLKPGDILVVDEASASLVRIDRETGAQELVTAGPPLNYPFDVAVEASGTILVSNGGDGRIIRVDPATGVGTPVSSGLLVAYAMGMALDPLGRAVAASSMSVARVDPATGAEMLLSVGGYLSMPRGLDIEADGSIVVVDVVGGGAIVRVNPDTGAQAIVSSDGSLQFATSVAVGNDGTLFAVSQREIVRVNPVTGAQEVIADLGDIFQMGTGIAMDGDDRILVSGVTYIYDPVSGANLAGVMRIDPSSGAKTLLSGGGLMQFPFGIAVVKPPSCQPSPAAGCAVAAKSTISLGAGAKRALSWSWLKGETDVAELGDPRTTTGYSLCLYDGGALRMSARIDAAGTCDGRPCWTSTGGRGFRFRHRSGSGSGLKSAQLKAGSASAQIKVKGGGVALPVPSLPLALDGPVTLQLVRHDGAPCWEASFPTFRRNTATQYKAKSP